ncbi:hypothetical protein EON63_04030 [archaeon]|nr:MAG: hypothetical protein EON63_04030 [archaeon]
MQVARHKPCAVHHTEDIFAENHTLYLVMELSKGGDLFDRIAQRKKYPEERAKQVLFNILQALVYMHERKVAHRDLKPENILLGMRYSIVRCELWYMVYGI